jgi:hypothetical protein
MVKPSKVELAKVNWSKVELVNYGTGPRRTWSKAELVKVKLVKGGTGQRQNWSKAELVKVGPFYHRTESLKGDAFGC